jgi:Fic family protein
MGKRAPSACLALNLLYRKPIIEAIDLEQALKVSNPTANSLINVLIDKQIVVEITGQQRGRVYSFNRYINLFVS